MADATRQTYTTLNDEKTYNVASIKHLGEILIERIRESGSGREHSLAVTRIEEGVMWAVKGITAPTV